MKILGNTCNYRSVYIDAAFTTDIVIDYSIAFWFGSSLFHPSPNPNMCIVCLGMRHKVAAKVPYLDTAWNNGKKSKCTRQVH